MNKQKLKYNIARYFWRITRPTTVGARAILVNDDNILLVRHTYRDSWYLPGGGVKKGETHSEGLVRELQEELGITLEEFSLFGTYTNDYEYKNDHIIIFISDRFDLKGIMDNEIKEFAFFPMGKLPKNVSPGTKRRVLEYMGNDWPVSRKW